ncbi:phosphatidate cytidylyltransferase [Noviherbaspirillum sp. CPCC 100848]|uniref:Phosphatidate cytidylyltransferase n=1 Tax=Noviherbaspirillum album TaxID=3080276 RepID=A0ABU6J729_9BURK|nr:phosphatidate cytidylyltransferase [Noviherbaspirillum sp. CPCC 100848]MEC4719449.1 phosphatidate cytidylyltransferase [Noviherbaspirillum sp. CPCC 100848]
MLGTRIITAVVLLAVLLSVLFSKSFLFFALVAALFFAAASWESFRLFHNRQPVFGAAVWTAVFLYLLYTGNAGTARLLFVLSVAIWVVRLIPSLKVGLPPLEAMGSRLLNGIYGITILACFLAVTVLFQQSPLYLLSVMALVWIADIGAYFSGKAFGRRKLAPTISPGKSWEGAIGGWIAVLVIAGASTLHPALENTFAPQILARWGWGGFILVMTVIVAFSVVGDLFESQLKRRAGMKDSSNLLPGHGGVLDRIDALIPTLPVAVLFGSWL